MKAEAFDEAVAVTKRLLEEFFGVDEEDRHGGRDLGDEVEEDRRLRAEGGDHGDLAREQTMDDEVDQFERRQTGVGRLQGGGAGLGGRGGGEATGRLTGGEIERGHDGFSRLASAALNGSRPTRR